MQNITIFFLILVAGITFSRFDDRLQSREEQATVDGVFNDIVQLAQAQARFVANPATIQNAVFASSPDELFNAGQLPVWESDPRYRFEFPTPNGFVVVYDADTEGFAADVARRFGNLSSVTVVNDVPRVSVGFPSPLELSIFDLYVRRSGDTIFGTIEFEAGSGADLILNDNAIRSEGSITVRNSSGTGLVDADIANAGALTVQSFRVVNQ